MSDNVVTLPVIRRERPGEPVTARELLLIDQRDQARADVEIACGQFWQMMLINTRLADLNSALIAKILELKKIASCTH